MGLMLKLEYFKRSKYNTLDHYGISEFESKSNLKVLFKFVKIYTIKMNFVYCIKCVV